MEAIPDMSNDDKLPSERLTNDNVAMEAIKVDPTDETTIVAGGFVDGPLARFSAVKRGVLVLSAVPLNVTLMDPTTENVAAENRSEPLPRFKFAFEPLPERNCAV